MTVNGNFPQHLTVAARTGVLMSPVMDNMPYRRVAMEFDLTQKTTTLVDLGGDPIVTEDPKAVDTLVEYGKTVTPKDWYVSVSINGNDVDDDQTGQLMRRFMGIMPAFQRHINSRVFTVLNGGDGGTYGGNDITTEAYFFDTAHVFAGGKNTTSQSNLGTAVLSADNYDTAWVAFSQFKDDQGNYIGINPNLLVCNPSNNKIAANITGNPNSYDTANNEINPYRGTNYITVPEFDSTAWVLIDESKPVKPLYVAIRKRPTLLDEIFDSEQPNGGLYTWRYHARYVVGYGNPMLAYMGKT